MAPKRSCCIRFSCFSPSSSSDEKGQDHPATSAGAPSSPSATDNYKIETLPGAPKSTEAPIPGSSNVVTPMKYEIEDVDHVNLNVSGTHQRDKAPVSESLNILRKSEGKYVNVNLNVPGAPSCNEASSSGYSNVPMKYEGEDVDANLNVSGAPSCNESPSSSRGAFMAIECKWRSPLSKIYPIHAVGLDEPIIEVLCLLEIESEKKAVTVILQGFGGMGKTTLADAVFSHVGGCKYSKVRLSEDIWSTPNIVELQKQILKDLVEPGETIPEFRRHEDGQRELEDVLERVQAFIYIDDVRDSDALRKLLPHDIRKAKKVRILLTTRNTDVTYAFPFPCKSYEMNYMGDEEAMIILQRIIEEGISDIQFKDIIQTCRGMRLMLTLKASFIACAPNKQEAYNTVMLQKKKENSVMNYAFAYDALPRDCKDPFLDICSYFNGWDWQTVEDIVGKDELKKLESRALVTRTTNGVASVHNIILTLASQMSWEESQGKQVRLSFTSARELAVFLQEKEEDAKGIKGIWLSNNKDVSEIPAITLDLMSESLRVLRLGNMTMVEGKCSKKFEDLVFFEAQVPQLPFLHDVSKFNHLRYLSYAPNYDLKLSEMPLSLRHMEFDGSLHSQSFQISFKDIQRHEHLRVLKLVNFSELTNLPKELGDQVKGLQELSLSNCKSIKKLPDSILQFPFLRILKVVNCSNLTELPVDFGSLSSLQELNLAGCKQLKALPDSVDKFSSLKLLNLSNCRRLLNLPQGLGKLTCLVELNLEYCKSLQSIPDSIGELKLLRALDLKDCRTLKELPDGFCNLFYHTSFIFPLL